MKADRLVLQMQIEMDTCPGHQEFDLPVMTYRLLAENDEQMTSVMRSLLDIQAMADVLQLKMQSCCSEAASFDLKAEILAGCIVEIENAIAAAIRIRDNPSLAGFDTTAGQCSQLWSPMASKRRMLSKN